MDEKKICKEILLYSKLWGLAVQWLRTPHSLPKAMVQSLVRELRSYKQSSIVNK